MTEEIGTPLLSLYVPTYNRAALLDVALRAILGQITPAMRAEVEVVVMDNASPDDTPQVMARAEADFPHITLRCVRRAENIGCDANFTDAPNRTRGEFVYMLSDDDVLLPGAVEKLLQVIREHPDLDAVALNVSHFTDRLEDQDMRVGFPLAEDRILRDRDEALRLYGSHISFLSCMAFRRAAVLGRDYTSRRDTNMGQAYLFLDALASARGIYLTSRRYLAVRQDNATGYSVFRVLFTSFHALMRHAQSLGYSPEVVRAVLDQHLQNVYGLILVLKSEGIGTLQPNYWDGAVRLLRSYGVSRFVLLKVIPRLLTPYGALTLVQRLRGRGAPPAPAGGLMGSAEVSAAPPTLSLCLPTYKRAALLDQALRAVLSQITPAIAPQVEVIVLDNASPDDTPEVVARAQAEFPDAPLRCVRRAENIGPDRNFTDALTQARGEFLYLLSDDDILLPGAVETLLRLIGEHPGFDAFALNVRMFRESPTEEGTSQPFTLEEDLVTHSRDEALELLNTHLVFLSCIAFRRANVLGRDYADKTGTVLIQAFFFVDALAPGRGFYATRQPLLAQRAENAGGYNFFRVFVTNFDLVLRYALLRGYSERAVDVVLQLHLRFIYHYVLIFKTRGHYDELRPDFPDALRRVLRAYRLNPFSLRFIVPRLLLPPGFYRLTQRRSRRHSPPP